MLFVLFGITAEMGQWSQKFFQEKGFELIQKYYYVPEDFAIRERYAKRTRSPKEDVLKCDFVYDNNGMLVGFNKEQIIDAVRGRKKCLITISSETISFIRQIKVAYGGYVTVLGTYIDERTLMTIFESLSDISEEELKRRINMGTAIKRNLLEDRKLFDDIVIYGGEGSLFDYKALATQYDYILAKAEKREKELNDKMYVELPYIGKEDYIFVSYSHLDSDKVFPFLHKLQLSGCRVWYDEGIKGGDNWRKILASKIQAENCKNFLLFSSLNSTLSRDVQAEINAALICDKKIISLRLDDSRFELDIEMYLRTHQELFADNSDIDKKLYDSIDETVKQKK